MSHESSVSSTFAVAERRRQHPPAPMRGAGSNHLNPKGYSQAVSHACIIHVCHTGYIYIHICMYIYIYIYIYIHGWLAGWPAGRLAGQPWPDGRPADRRASRQRAPCLPARPSVRLV